MKEHIGINLNRNNLECKNRPPAEYFKSVFCVHERNELSVTVSDSSKPLVNRRGQLGGDHVNNALIFHGIGWQNYYHFVTEYLTHMYDIRDDDLSDYVVILFGAERHVPSFIGQWLDVVRPGISKKIKCVKRDSDVYIEYAKVMGRGIGGPRRLQPALLTTKEMNWLKTKVDIVTNTDKQDAFVLFKRSSTRCTINWQEIYETCVDHATRLGLELCVLDDRDMPSVVDQLNTLARAKIVTGMHGAGYTNLIACKPNTQIIEHITNEPPPHPNCFEKLANFYNLPYNEIPVTRTAKKPTNRTDGTVDVECFIKILNTL